MRRVKIDFVLWGLCSIGWAMFAGPVSASTAGLQESPGVSLAVDRIDIDNPVPELKLLFDDVFAGHDGVDFLEQDRTRDLIDYLSFLYSRLMFFQQNNDLVSSFIRKTLPNDQAVQKTLDRLLADQRQAMEYGKAGPWRTRSQIKSLDLMGFYQVLKAYESVLMNRLKKFQVISDQLRALKVEALAQHRLGVRNRMGSADRSSDATLKTLRENLKMKDQIIKDQQEQLSQLTQKFSEMQLGLDVFRDRLKETEDRLAGLLKEVAARSLDLYAKDQEAQETKRHFEDLQGRFVETQERLRLVQRIIQEKDAHIQELEGEVLNLHSTVNTAADAPLGDLGDLRIEMTSQIQTMQNNIQDSQDKIGRLEQRFQDVALANAQLRFDLTEKEAEIHSLSVQSRQKDEMIADLEKGFHSKTQKVLEMRDIITIYKDKLREYAHRLEEQNRQPQPLHPKLPARPGKASADPEVPSPLSHDEAARRVIADYPNLNDLLWNIEAIESRSREQLLQLEEIKGSYED